MTKFYREFLLVSLVILSPLVHAKPLPNIPTPAFITLQSLSETPLSFGAFDMKTYAFNASKGNTDIRKFYKKQWKGKIKTVDAPGWYYHSTFDGKYLISVQVRKSGLSNFAGTNNASGFMSISEPGAIKNKKIVKIEPFYPMAPGTLKLTDLTATDMGKESRTVVFDRPGSVAQNLQTYKKHFERKGWLVSQKNMAEAMITNFGASTLIMQQGNDELIVSFIPDNNRTKVVSVLVKK